MKTNSDHRPPALLDLGDGSYHFNFNIKEIEVEDESGNRMAFEYDTVHVQNDRYETIVAAMIRDRYSLDDELSIHRQRDEKPVEFQVYFDYCEECKTIVKQGLGL
ncbi:hypothetical protein SAMN05216364_100626 [Porphyromonadaceae bacterium KHP3R9]|nr:hypothetical protein SAMN05216364_100626 [Porphyromonadaceae bacterium KHP3R9]